MKNQKTSSAHTPAPWTVLVDEYMENCISVGSDDDMTVVAHVTGIVAESKANAKLIAAAPELLWACEFALATLNWRLGKNGGSVKGDMLTDCKRDLENAITKAKGQ